jgi:hypothetical protein
LRIFGGPGGIETYLLSRNNGILDKAFANERDIKREPGVDPAFERADPW